MYEGKQIGVIIPAAGFGKRMGNIGVAKQFVEIAGKSILARTIQKFQDTHVVDTICISVTSEMLDFVRNEIVAHHRFTKVHHVVVGGKERQDSVYAGLGMVKCDIVLVHDAVRPFITEAMINSLVEACCVFRAAVLGVRPKDTIKKGTSEGFVQETISRDQLWNIQTPQVFEYGILRAAFDKARNENFYGTDECMLVERIGQRIKIVEGDYSNIKITTPEDIKWAELFLI